MKLKKLIAGLAAVVMISAAVMSSAGAYFTDYDPAEGQATYIYSTDMQTVLKEKADINRKELVVSNTGKIDVKVRARLYYPGTYADLVSYETSDYWSAGEDGWYYYIGGTDSNGILKPGNETEALAMKINLPATGFKDGDVINVVAVYEAIPADVSWPEEG